VDWSAFVDTIDELTPPEDREMAHRQMISAFDAYVHARDKAADVCAGSHGSGGPCFTPVTAASDQWSAAPDRAYELPCLPWQSLLGWIASPGCRGRDDLVAGVRPLLARPMS